MTSNRHRQLKPRSFAWLSLVIPLALAAIPARAESEPAVARAQILLNGKQTDRGTVFFVPARDEIGVAAIGAAHSFDLAELAQVGELRFWLPHSQRSVAVSSRHLVKPGRPFRVKGGTLRDDYIVFALDNHPSHIRVLQPKSGSVKKGTRVRILGIPSKIPQDEDDIFGTLVETNDTRIEVDLDNPEDLRGWGGAPVLTMKGDEVIGILQAAWPVGGTLRVGVAPIEGVASAMKSPLAGGLGQPFSEFAALAVPIPEPGENPFQAQTKPGARNPRLSNQQAIARSASRPQALPREEHFLGEDGSENAELRLEVEYPENGAIVGSTAGAFIAGHVMALLGELQQFDIVIVIDTSGSTSEPTGVDVNGNGVVGKSRLGGLGDLFSLGPTDPGDSILAAEVTAARELLKSLDPRSTRVAVVTFAGQAPVDPRGFRRRVPRAAVTEEPLTTDYTRVEDALDRIMSRGADGMTHMAAGIDQATVELLGLQGGLSEPNYESDKIMLFFTDGQPTLPYEGFLGDNVRAVLRASDRAQRAGIRIHSFALGPEALEGPIATVEMARRTDGFFTPVREPADLIQVVEEVSFVNIDAIEIRNVTTGDAAEHVTMNADGSWSGLVPVTTGKNEIEVVATASDGSQVRTDHTLQHAPGAADPTTPRELVAQRNRLLERRLVELRRDRIAAEREQAEATRRELVVEIEEERAKAAARAEAQRKELDLEVERNGSP